MRRLIIYILFPFFAGVSAVIGVVILFDIGTLKYEGINKVFSGAMIVALFYLLVSGLLYLLSLQFKNLTIQRLFRFITNIMATIITVLLVGSSSDQNGLMSLGVGTIFIIMQGYIELIYQRKIDQQMT